MKGGLIIMYISILIVILTQTITTAIEVSECQSCCEGHTREVFIFDDVFGDAREAAEIVCANEGCINENCDGLEDASLNACEAGKDFIRTGSHTFVPPFSIFEQTNFCIDGEISEDPPPTPEPTKSPTTLSQTSSPTTLAPTRSPTTKTPTTTTPTNAPVTSAPTTIQPTKAPTTLAPTTLKPTLAPVTLAPTDFIQPDFGEGFLKTMKIIGIVFAVLCVSYCLCFIVSHCGEAGGSRGGGGGQGNGGCCADCCCSDCDCDCGSCSIM